MNLILSLKTLNLCYPECLLTPQWWENDHENEEGKLFAPITSELGLQQLICEPTHFIGESKSCIDLKLINQPNLFLETGVHPSLHEQCHHHIVFAKITADNLAPPPYNRKIWFYMIKQIYRPFEEASNFIGGRKLFNNSSVLIYKLKH